MEVTWTKNEGINFDRMTSIIKIEFDNILKNQKILEDNDRIFLERNNVLITSIVEGKLIKTMI